METYKLVEDIDLNNLADYYDEIDIFGLDDYYDEYYVDPLVSQDPFFEQEDRNF